MQGKEKTGWPVLPGHHRPAEEGRLGETVLPITVLSQPVTLSGLESARKARALCH